ncbi:lysozyme [Vibrio sagamiensis]|uniref:Lysozyme n=1 Tax=Vibrio sagamiensis NBRC 104589 TaxID=1219064 RepID=A0A511QIM2_9VIBR|nr:lysozyme [Vibrio sagamiensis]PNQ69005.1 lysozyme [Vibrio agarivorans]GEM77174.1 lysozyme [Vibrio sagamiensis NBRC 104589]
MKKLINKAVCSVGVILSVVFSLTPNMQTSQLGLAHIANLEGCRTKAYQCSANVWTNGLGHTTGVKQGDVVDEAQIAHNFIADVQSAEKVVNRYLNGNVTQAQFDVLVSFVFNLGSNNFKRSTMLKLFNQNQPLKACLEFSRWVYVNGKNCKDPDSQCSGLVKRREIEKQACLNGW